MTLTANGSINNGVALFNGTNPSITSSASLTFSNNVLTAGGVTVASISVNNSLYVTSGSFALGGLRINSGANDFGFPANRGTNGQFLQTNGAGTTSWQTLSATGLGAVIGGGTPSAGIKNMVFIEANAPTTISSTAVVTFNTANNILTTGGVTAASITMTGASTFTSGTGIGQFLGALYVTSNTFALGGLRVNAIANDFEFPANRGTNGQFLQTNGAGTTSWQAITPSNIGALTYGGTATTSDKLVYETGASTLSSNANLTWNSINNILSASNVVVSGNMSATNATLGPVGNSYIMPNSRGVAGQFLQTDGTANANWVSLSPSSVNSAFFTTAPTGSRQIVFEAGGAGTASLSSSASLTWNNTNNILTTPNAVITGTLAATAATIPALNDGVTIANGLTVTAGGATINGNSLVNGTLGGITGLTVSSGGVAVNAGGLTVSAGSTNISGGLNTNNISVGTGGATVGGIYRNTNLAFAFPADISGWAQSLQTATLTNAAVGGTVSVSPVNALPAGIVVSFARVSAANTIQIGLQSTTSGSVAVGTINFSVTVIQ